MPNEIRSSSGTATSYPGFSSGKNHRHGLVVTEVCWHGGFTARDPHPDAANRVRRAPTRFVALARIDSLRDVSPHSYIREPDPPCPRLPA
jgi:hypothetical protein